MPAGAARAEASARWLRQSSSIPIAASTRARTTSGNLRCTCWPVSSASRRPSAAQARAATKSPRRNSTSAMPTWSIGSAPGAPAASAISTIMRSSASASS